MIVITVIGAELIWLISDWEFVISFTFMHLADTFIQSDLQCIQVIHILSVCVFEPTTFALLTQRSTTEPQEHHDYIMIL